MSSPRINLNENLRHFCQKWQITELSLFGSVLRDDFRPDSDIDVLVTFAPNAPWSLLDLVNMEYELADLTGRDIDLLEKQAIEKKRQLATPRRNSQYRSSYLLCNLCIRVIRHRCSISLRPPRQPSRL